MDNIYFMFGEEHNNCKQKHSAGNWVNISLNKEAVCPICLEIAKNPMKCSVCDKVFCKDCIETYMKNGICPFDCKDPSFMSLTSTTIKCDACEKEMGVDKFQEHATTSVSVCKICKKEIQANVMDFL